MPRAYGPFARGGGKGRINMRSVYISLPTVEAAQTFVGEISALRGNFDLMSGEYIIDARSLMGIFSLDLTKPVKLIVEKDTEETMRAISRFIADAPPGVVPPVAGPDNPGKGVLPPCRKE